MAITITIRIPVKNMSLMEFNEFAEHLLIVIEKYKSNIGVVSTNLPRFTK